MFERLKSGWDLIATGNRALFSYPALLLPLLGVWGVYAPSVLWLRFGLRGVDRGLKFAAVCAVVVLLSVLITWACAALVAMIENIERDGRAQPASALAGLFPGKALSLLPLALLWALLWILLLVLGALFSKKRRGADDDEPLSAQSAAETLLGDDSRWSLSSAFFDALQKAVRMTVFLAVPAVVWDAEGPFGCMRQGLSVLKHHVAEFITGFALTELAATLVFLPPGLLLYVVRKGKYHLPDEVWYGVILYCGLAWSYMVYLEQMFCSELYLWHRNWLAASKKDKSLKLTDVKRPDLLDGVNDMNARLKGK